MTKTFKTIYFDGDILLNKAAFALERRRYDIFYADKKVHECETKKEAVKIKTEHETPDLIDIKLHRWVEKEELLEEIINNMIEGACKDLQCQDYLIMLGPKTNSSNTFRHRAATTVPYKGNRDPNGRPILYSKAREYLRSDFECVHMEDGEADDILSIYLTKDPTNTIIASIDKDLCQVPGWHYNLNTKEVILSRDPGKLWISRRKDKKRIDLKGYGFKWFCAQMLLGDSIDNIQKPLKGYGPRKIHNYLDEAKTVQECWNKIKNFYKKHSNLERLHENAMLLWMIRNPDEYYNDWLENNNVE